MEKLIEISDDEATLVQKAAEGVGLALTFDDEGDRKKALDIYGRALIDDLLQSPSFISKVENAIVKILEEKGNET